VATVTACATALLRLLLWVLEPLGFAGPRMVQFALYLLVGGITFWIDIGGFLIIRLFGTPVLPASAASFVIAVLANYALCRAIVFRGGRFSRIEELGRLFVVALVGLGLNSAMVWFLAVWLHVDPTASKVLAVIPVLAWNYLARRALVFDAEMAGGVAAVVARTERPLGQSPPELPNPMK